MSGNKKKSIDMWFILFTLLFNLYYCFNKHKSWFSWEKKNLYQISSYIINQLKINVNMTFKVIYVNLWLDDNIKIFYLLNIKLIFKMKNP